MIAGVSWLAGVGLKPDLLLAGWLVSGGNLTCWGWLVVWCRVETRPTVGWSAGVGLKFDLLSSWLSGNFAIFNLPLVEQGYLATRRRR